MKPELMLLAWAVVLTLAQMLVAATGSAAQYGVMPLFGNREGLAPLTGWAGRAYRAHHNMLENLVLFAALVLVAQLLNKGGTPQVLLGAQLFLYGRIAYALIYVAGIPWLRTLAWAVSVVGLAMIFIAVM
jgi:uncharacterized MAPEG superfamily protein